MFSLTSPSNPKLKAIAQLAVSTKARREAGLTVLDGIHLIQTWLMHDGVLKAIVVSDQSVDTTEIKHCIDQATQQGCQEIIQIPKKLFERLSPVDTPTGILALIDIPQANNIFCASDVVLLDAVQDPGNVGAIIRTAAAAGIKQILLSENCAQGWSPKVLRAAMGAHLFVNILEHVDLSAWLADYHGISAATTLAEDAASLFEIDLKKPIAWIFGSEGQGICPTLLNQAHLKVKIPMFGMIESLNVAATASVCLFEMRRQRIRA